MRRYRVTFMEAPDEESAWKTPVWEVEEREPIDQYTTLCEVGRGVDHRVGTVAGIRWTL